MPGTLSFSITAPKVLSLVCHMPSIFFGSNSSHLETNHARKHPNQNCSGYIYVLLAVSAEYDTVYYFVEVNIMLKYTGMFR